MPTRRSSHNVHDDLQVVRLDQVVLLDALQVRVQLDREAVATYTQIFREVPEAQCTCPPIAVYLQDGVYVVSDGFHRVTAARHAGRTTLNAYVRTGTQEEAWLYAMEHNIRHGMPYTRADKQKIVTWFLDHPRYGTLPTRDIAALTGNLVPHSTVANIRNRREKRELEVLSKLDKMSPTGEIPAADDPVPEAAWDEGPTGDERLDTMLERLESVEARHHAQYRRLTNIEGHMELLLRGNDPALFGAWLREGPLTTRPGYPVQALFERGLPRYIRWLQRLLDAYRQVPDARVFEDTDVFNLDGDAADEADA